MSTKEADGEMDIEKTNKRCTVRVGAAVAALTLLFLLAIVLAVYPRQSAPSASPAPTDVHLTPAVIDGNGGVLTRVGDDDSTETMHSGLCPICFEEAMNPEIYVACAYCCELTKVSGKEFTCGICGEKQLTDSFSISERWVYHSLSICESLSWYPLFVSYNSGGGLDTEEVEDQMTVIEINGEFDLNGDFHTSPWYTYSALPSSLTASISGEYAVHVYDGNGGRLAVSRFDAKDGFRFLAPDASPMAGAAIPVRLIVPCSGQAAKIAILKGDTELYARDVSSNPPEVKFTCLVENQSLSNKTTITWEASDADGEELFFRLWYCTGKKEYFLLASDIMGNSYQADLTDHPGSENGYFHIYATDGVRTAEAKSPVISTPFKPPVIITEQKTIQKFKITEELYFQAEVYDAQDGRLTGNSVVWMLDGGQFEASSVLQSWPYRLAPGVYTFTCRATNSAGLSAQKEFSFEVIDDESNLPDDWSREEIIHALKNGYVVPTGRIDSPVTRGQYAGLMYTLWYYLNPEGLPEYDKSLVTDCGEYGYGAFLMAYLGVMEAPGGIFAPDKSLTQSEALRILYQTYMLAENPGLNLSELIYSEKEAETLLQSAGIFNHNPYQPEARLSKKLALVWISRVDQWLLR